MSKTLRAHRLNWISIAKLREPMRVKAKIRHRHEAADATIESIGDEVLATFDIPQRAITPGQAVVFLSRRRSRRWWMDRLKVRL